MWVLTVIIEIESFSDEKHKHSLVTGRYIRPC